MSYVLQEEEEAQAKADKIKLALEKLKEAKVKKVNYESLLHGAVNVELPQCQDIPQTDQFSSVQFNSSVLSDSL